MMAEPNEVAAVTSFAQHYGLTILDENFEARVVKVQGNAQQMDEAFGIKLCDVADAHGNRYISYTGSVTVPSAIAPYVTAVLGLDQRPVARHHHGA
jgi:kumamolisin